MNTQRPGSTTEIDDPRHEQVLEWLGLPAGASTDDVEATHDRLLGFLDTAPLVLQPWARRQVKAANAARTAILEPEARQADDDEALAEALTEPGAPVGSPAPAAAAASAGPAAAAPVQPAAPAASVTTAKPGKNPTTLLLLALLTVAVVIGVYFMGGGGSDQAGTAPGASPTASNAAMGATPVPVDPAKVEELSAKVKADPKDTTSMRELANMYFGAADFTNAAVWQNKVLEITPKDTEARLALGAAKFNGGDMAEAEKQWREVLRLDPKNAEAHYNLGFFYLSQTPPQIDRAEAEWAKVAELAPGSEIAKTATAHLDRLKNMPTVGSSATPSAKSTP